MSKPLQINSIIFDYSDYKKYLKNVISSKPKRGRGVRSAMAAALNCQVSHVSQVLNGDAHFSVEQADQVNGFLGHTSEEAQFFLLLVQQARAGTRSLRDHFTAQILQILEKRLIMKDRFNIKKNLTSENQAIYYSAWYYAAVHIIVTIERYRSKEAIARYLGLSVKKTAEVIQFLLSTGLLTQENGKLQTGVSRIHLGSDSTMISKHHTNWRIRAIQCLESEESAADIHYSSVVSMSENDFLRVKTLLVDMVTDVKAIVKESKEEKLVCFALDLFQT